MVYGGVLGDALLDASNAYLGAVIKAPQEREEQRKRELENKRLESQVKLDEARAAWEERRAAGGTRPVYVKTKQGVLERNPETGDWTMAYEAPAAEGKPDEVVKWQALKSLEKIFKKPFTEFGPAELTSDDPVARGLWDIYGIRSDLQVLGADGRVISKSVTRGAPSGPPGTPAAPTPAPETPQAPAAAPRTGERGSAAPAGRQPSGQETLTPAFLQKAQEVADRVGTSLDNLLRVMHFETGGEFSPATRNRAGSGATGLIQFMPETAERLGTTTDVLARMSPETQLQYVEQYLKPYAGKIGSLQDLYLAVFRPAAIGRAPDAPLLTRTSHPKAYLQNAGLDQDGDGVITVKDAVDAVQRTTAGVTYPAGPRGTATRQAPAPEPAVTGRVAGPGAPTPAPPTARSTPAQDEAYRRALQPPAEAVPAATVSAPTAPAPTAPVPTAPLPTAPAPAATQGTGTASSPGGFRLPRTPEQQAAEERKVRDQAMQEGKNAAEQEDRVLKWRADERAAEDAGRDKVRLAMDKDRLVIAQEAHKSQEEARQRAIQEHKEGGMPTKDQATWANHLYVLGKVDHPYYTELDEAQKKLVDDTVRIPKDAEEARKAADEIRAGKADIRAENEAARQREKDRLGGGVSKDQEMTANSLFQLGKAEHQYYHEMDSKERDLVNRTIKQPDVDRAYREQARLLMSQRKEVRDALKLAQPHLDELRALDTTRHLTEMIVPLLTTSNIGIMGKAKSVAGSILQHSPFMKGQFRRDAERQLMAEAKAQGKDVELNRVIDENAIQARILANVEDDQGQAQRLTGLTAQSRLETLSSILVYAHAMATKRGAGGTTRGLIKTDIDKAEKLFNPELWTKDPDQLLRNLQALQEFIQHARPIIRETVTSYGIDPDTKRYIGTPTLDNPGTVTLTPEQLRLLQPAAPKK